MSAIKKSKFFSEIFIFPVVGLIISIFGSFVGTYCWYENNKAKAYVTYGGTAIGDSESIQVGLASENKLNGFAEKYGLIEDHTTIDTKYIYWSSDSQLRSSVVKEFETLIGHASNEMIPVTSGSYDEGDELVLKSAPSYLNRNLNNIAGKSCYSYIPLAFRGGQGVFNYYVNKSELRAENNVKEAVRICFENPNIANSRFIYNPSNAANGETTVGGLLNLDAFTDDLYDYPLGTDEEYIYGEFSNLSYSGEKYTGQKEVKPEDVTTFRSNHQANLYIPTFTPKTAVYKGSGSVLGQKVLTYTDSTTNVALLNMTVYIEGWDHAIVDQNLLSEYDLLLSFTSTMRA